MTTVTNALQEHTTQLQDRAELIDLLYRLGATLDEKRFDDLRSIYSERAQFEFPGAPAPADLASAIDGAKKMGEQFAHTQHVMSSPIVELNGDSATLRANLIATHVYRDDKPAEYYQAGIVYHFRAIRTPEGWRFSHVKLQRVWSNGER